MNVNITQLKKDCRDGYYYLLDCKEVSSKFYVTVLNERDENIYFHIANYNTMISGCDLMSKKDFLKIKKADLIKFINQLNFYAYDVILNDENED